MMNGIGSASHKPGGAPPKLYARVLILAILSSIFWSFSQIRMGSAFFPAIDCGGQDKGNGGADVLRINTDNHVFSF
jgi:hypothetical protein